MSNPRPAVAGTGSWLLSYRRRREARAALLMSAPAILLLTVFLVVPFLMAIGFSFTDQRLIPNRNLPTRFVGLRNYLRLFSNATFHRALINNFVFALVVVPVQSAFALCLAMLVNAKLRFTNVFRTVFFSPVVITMVVVSIVWYLLYNPAQGFINQALRTISFGAWPDVGWLNDTRFALPAIMILSIWQGVGFQMIIFLAGLQDIPVELYEAADVDGATAWQKFVGITLPQLRNTTLFVVVSTTILSFKLFQQVWVMTKGGPQEATMTAIVLMYREGFRQGRIGTASAIAVFFFVIVLVVSLLQRGLMSERSEGAKR